MSYTLLIWELVPEDTELYVIPNEVADRYSDYFHRAHNKFINSDEMNHGMKFLNTALAQEAPEEGFEEYLGVLRGFKWDKDSPIDKPITAVYLSGFIL